MGFLFFTSFFPVNCEQIEDRCWRRWVFFFFSSEFIFSLWDERSLRFGCWSAQFAFERKKNPDRNSKLSQIQRDSGGVHQGKHSRGLHLIDINKT